MDKILLPQSASAPIQVTNDGATILKSVLVDNPAAKILCDISRIQDEEVGDGTTSVCVLAAELLRQAEKLIDQRRIHPQTIIQAYRLASQAAINALTASSSDAESSIPSGEGQFSASLKESLMQIAKTTLSSKVLASHREYFAQMAVDAVARLGGSRELERIQIIKKTGGRLEDSYLAPGFILPKRIGANQPKRIEGARILIANTPMDTDKAKVFGSKIKAESTAQLAEIERVERDKMRGKVQKIASTGVNCFINRQLIYNWPEQLFADAGISSIEHADFEGVERLALVTGAEIASTFEDASQIRIGLCDLIEEVMIGDEVMVQFSGLPAGSTACTVVLRGSSEQLLEEAERSLHDALCVLASTAASGEGTVLGGGASEMLMAEAVERLASAQVSSALQGENAVADSMVNTIGKLTVAIEGFAEALRALPTILANNGGYDGCELVGQLKQLHKKQPENASMGIDMYAGKVADMRVLGVRETLKSKRQVVASASEAAEMILRVDNILRSAPRKREDSGCHH
jgi:T-complex protein 1 subunit beta